MLIIDHEIQLNYVNVNVTKRGLQNMNNVKEDCICSCHKYYPVLVDSCPCKFDKSTEDKI